MALPGTGMTEIAPLDPASLRTARAYKDYTKLVFTPPPGTSDDDEERDPVSCVCIALRPNGLLLALPEETVDATTLELASDALEGVTAEHADVGPSLALAL